MKRFYILIFSAALLAGLWQWSRLHDLETRSSAAAAQIAEAQAAPAASKKSGPVAAGKADAGAAGDASLKLEDTPLEVDEFFELAGEVSRLQAVTTAGADRQELREKISALFIRLPATPLARLKIILEKLPASGISADGKEQTSTLIMNVLAKSDPAAAAAYALQFKTETGTLETAMRTWAKLDASAAATWLDKTETTGTLPPGIKVEQLRLLLYPHQIAADPGGAAVDQIARFQPAHLGDLLAETAALLNTPARRGAFLKRLTGVPGLSAEAVGRFLQEVGRTSSVEAATALLQEAGGAMPPARFDEIAALTVTARIDGNTPAHADWLLKNLRGPSREPAITRLVESWTGADFNAAAAWLQKQPPSDDHDIAVAAFAPQVATREPPSAVDWAVTIADSARRAAVLDSLYEKWQARSPQEATDYFQQKGLTIPVPAP